ncbi:flagellar assembly protein FliW [Clostridium grantii]|uniref:Flagellar assembly factor FliW n=1 Tax=Clostridium grantii DSM 8605 TaxID=1121316 RepID=A0A1M5W7A1_9CLOT|nr:flagellar assembly protein FliW [Clostridium grantii]SHH83402.1 flagellar assembly factor FliW [Clostridium grantii DSM 8605]
MLIKSRFLGNLEIDESKIVTFEEGILGFEDIKEYCIVPMPEKEDFYLLQSIEDENISFIIIKPWDFFKQYEINLQEEHLQTVDIEDASQVAIYSILSLSQLDITANLLAPVVINADTNKGAQIVLHSSTYKTKHSIYASESKGESLC